MTSTPQPGGKYLSSAALMVSAVCLNSLLLDSSHGAMTPPPRPQPLAPLLRVVAVRYWVDASAPLVIRYATQFKRSGDWDMANFDAVFADPAMTSVASTNLNAQGEGKKDLPF